MQKTQKRLQIKTKKLMNSLFVGNFKSAFHGRGIEFQDFREYSPEDDAKYIDWVISGREGKTIMRRYREDKEGTILCIFDNSHSLNFRSGVKYELANELIMLIAQASLMSGESFGGYHISSMGHEYIAPKKSQVALQKFLAYRDPQDNTKALSLDFFLKNPLKRSIVFVISDSLEIDETSFRIAGLKHDLIYLHISDRFENTLDGSGIETLRGRGSLFGINLDNTKKKELYKSKRKEKLDIFAKKIRSLGGEIAFIDDTKAVFSVLLALMKRREK